MDDTDIKLSSTEARFVSSWLILASVGGTIGLIIGNATGHWAPEYALVALLVLSYLGFNIWVARSRRRSIRSVLARGLPDRLRRSSKHSARGS